MTYLLYSACWEIAYYKQKCQDKDLIIKALVTLAYLPICQGDILIVLSHLIYKYRQYVHTHFSMHKYMSWPIKKNQTGVFLKTLQDQNNVVSITSKLK